MRRVTACAAVALLPVGAASARAEQFTAAAQTALVAKYCAVRHTDASKNGGISFQHYDAAIVDPPLFDYEVVEFPIAAHDRRTARALASCGRTAAH